MMKRLVPLALCWPLTASSDLAAVESVHAELARDVCPGKKSRLFGIAAHSSQVETYARWARRARVVCEVGFSCGHSAATFLEANPDAVLLSFDFPSYPWATAARAFFASRYGARFRIIDGDSEKTLPAFVRANPQPRCDLVVVDGRHDYVHPLLDLVWLLQIAHCNASIVLDDVCDPARCHAHHQGGRTFSGESKKGTNNEAVVGPTQAWAEARRLGYVREEEAYFAEAAGGANDRGWVRGVHVCAADGSPKRPAARYSSEPIDVQFDPDRPTRAQQDRAQQELEDARRRWGDRGHYESKR